MKTPHKLNFMAAALVCALALTTTIAQAADALPSWNDGKTKQPIVDFVKRATTKGGKDFVPLARRLSSLGTCHSSLDTN